MATISENLLIIKGIKDDIKSAIIEKGQTVEDDFSTYAEAILNISGGGGEEYTPLEYLGSDNGSYFNTGYKPDIDTKVRFGITVEYLTRKQFYLVSTNTPEYPSKDGWLAFRTDNFWEHPDHGTSGLMIRGGDYGNDLNVNFFTNYEYELSDRKIYCVTTGQIDDQTGRSDTVDYTQALNIVLGSPQNGSETFAKYTLKYVDIYQSDSLVRSFTPAYNSEGIVGFYDSITKAFIKCPNMNVHPDLGTIYITENGDYDVSEYNFASVNVQPKDVPYFDYGSETGTFSLQKALHNIQFPSTYAKYTSLENAFKGMDLETIEIDNLNSVTTIKYAFSDMKNLKSISLPQMPNVKSLDYMFQYTSNLEQPIHLTFGTQDNIGLYSMMPDASKVTELTITGGSGYSFGYMCDRCYGLTSVDMSGMLPAYRGSTTTSSSLNSTFRDCSSLETIKLPDLSGKSSDNSSGTFQGCTSLKNLEIGGLGDYQTLEKWRLEEATQLTVQSLNNVIAALPTITSGRKCSLGATNLAKLSEAEIAVATAKGWTLI